MATVEDAVLILAQEGAEVGPVLAAWHRTADEPSVVILQQLAGESLTTFRRRLHLRIEGIGRSGHSIERGAFVAKSGFGLQDVLATVALLSSLVTVMIADGVGRVYLWSQAGDSRAVVALEALADAMRDQVRGTGIQVITEDSAYSGVHDLATVGARRSYVSGA